MDDPGDWITPQAAPANDPGDWITPQPVDEPHDQVNYTQAPKQADDPGDWITPQAEQQPEAEGAFGTALRTAAHGILPAVAGAATGLVTGAAGGAIAGTGVLPGIGTLGGTLIGGLGGALVGGYAASTAQEAGAKMLGFDDSQQMAVNAAMHPIASAVGSALPAAIPFGFGGKAIGLGARAAYGAIAGGFEAGSELVRGEDLSPANILATTAVGGALARPRSLLQPFEAAGNRLGTRTGELWHGAASSDAAAGTAQVHPAPRDVTGDQPANGEPYAKQPAPRVTPVEEAGAQAIQPDPANALAIEAKLNPQVTEVPEAETAAAAPPRPQVTEMAEPSAASAPEPAPRVTPVEEPAEITRRLDAEFPRVPEAQAQERPLAEAPPLQPEQPAPATPREAVAQRAPDETIGDRIRRFIADERGGGPNPLDRGRRKPPAEEIPPTHVPLEIEAGNPRVQGDLHIEPNPDGPGHVLMRGNETVGEPHPNLGQAMMAMNRTAKAAAGTPAAAPHTPQPGAPLPGTPGARAPAAPASPGGPPRPPAGGGVPPPPHGPAVPPGGAGAPPPLGGNPSPAANPKFAAGFHEAVNKVVDTYKRTFDPARISELALKGQAPARQSRVYFEGEKTRISLAGRKAEEMWDKVPEAERLKAMDDYQNGRPVAPEFKEYFDKRLGPELDKAHKEEAQLGSKAAYRDDYIPHEWEPPKQGQPPINDHFKTMGPTWFQKARTFDFIAEGMKAGYKLKNTNPEVILRSRLIAGADMRSKMELLNDWKGLGVATQAADEAARNALTRKGWQTINAPDREQWMISPDVTTIWKNGIEAKGLWSDQSLMGDAYRGWMAFKSLWIPIRLAASAFHVLHVAHINMNTNLARAAGQAVRGDMDGAVRSLGQAFSVKSGVGIRGREQWQLPENERSPQGKIDVKLMEEGGFAPMMNEEMRIDAGRQFAKALADKNVFKIPWHGARLAIQKIQAPLFEQWIPHLKTAAYLNDAAALLQRRPDLLADPVNRKVALTEIAKSIDNRFGEMFYGGLFWNRYAKDVSIGSFLSLGWNLGFAREFGGAAIEAVTRPAAKFIPGMAPSATRAVARDATNKIAFATLYMGTAAAIGGMMTKMLTGEDPKDMNDYIFPRVGGTNTDGSPRRLTTMFYTREVPMLMKHIEEKGGGVSGTIGGAGAMLWNKMLLEPFVELAKNRNYFGKEIYDTNAPGYQQFMQAMQHTLGEQFSPMTVTGAARAQETGGRPIETALAYAGFGPAPSYANKDAMQNRISSLYNEHVAPGSRAYEDEANTRDKLKARADILNAKQKGDSDALSAAIKAGANAGLKPAYIKSTLKDESGDQKMFKQLPASDQVYLLGQATPQQLKRYIPFANKETRTKWFQEHPEAPSATRGYQEGGPVEDTRPNPILAGRAVPTSTNTPLAPLDEMAYREWVKQNRVPTNPNAQGPQDYDMRGFYRGLQQGNPMAQSAVDPNDQRLHYTDYWKTPTHQTFSNASQWAGPDAPQWTPDDKLVSPGGRVLFDDRNQQPKYPWDPQPEQ